MLLIRGFLWFLVAVMTLQGFLHADEYGTATSMLGGVSMTMAIMKESLGATTRSLFSSTQAFVSLPRVIVQAALKETALHPGIQVVPKLQQTLKLHQRTWDLFREEEVSWMLRHADLVGGVLSDPEARQLWTAWDQTLNYSQAALNASRAAVCIVKAMDPTLCNAKAADVVRYKSMAGRAQEAVNRWNEILYLHRGVSTRAWWSAIFSNANASQHFSEFATAVARLHDIDKPSDGRLKNLTILVSETTIWLARGKSPWLYRLLQSLLTGEMWAGCLEHVRLREGRVRDLMMLAGIQDMESAHERVLNASLRVVSSDADRRLVQDWFGEMSGYAWWLSDDLPSLVRRCVGQEAGDCTRIGPTEIATLSAKIAERERIIGNWTRRIYIGMWNAMPIIGILFVLELVLLCVDRRAPSAPSYPQPLVLKLEGQSTTPLSLTNG